MGIISKGLARIEHKLDLLLEGQAAENPYIDLRPFGDKEHQCSVCRQSVTYYVDTQEKQIARRCGCDLGLQVPIDPASLMQPSQPVTPNKGMTHVEESDE